MLDQRYSKTEAGRAEIKARTLTQLSRSGRNLLLMLDGTRTAREWLGMVNGATEADVALLLSHGLIAGPSVAAVAPVAPAAAAAAPAPSASAAQYEQLYSYLTGHAKQYLGLIKGYKTVLAVESCPDLAALEVIAERFLLDVEQAQGPAVAHQVRQSLGL